MSRDPVSDLKYRSAISRAKRPPLNWFAVFGIVLSTLFLVWWVCGLGWLAIVAAAIVFVGVDRFNRRKILERMTEIKLRFGKLED